MKAHINTHLELICSSLPAWIVISNRCWTEDKLIAASYDQALRIVLDHYKLNDLPKNWEIGQWVDRPDPTVYVVGYDPLVDEPVVEIGRFDGEIPIRRSVEEWHNFMRELFFMACQSGADAVFFQTTPGQLVAALARMTTPPPIPWGVTVSDGQGIEWVGV